MLSRIRDFLRQDVTSETSRNRYYLLWYIFVAPYCALNLLYIANTLGSDIHLIYKLHAALAVFSHAAMAAFVFGLFSWLITFRIRSINMKSFVLSVIFILIFYMTWVDINVFKVFQFHINRFILSEFFQPGFFASVGVHPWLIIRTILQYALIILILSSIAVLVYRSDARLLRNIIHGDNLLKKTIKLLLLLVVAEKAVMLIFAYNRPPYIYRLSQDLPVGYINWGVHTHKLLKSVIGMNDEKESFNELPGSYQNLEYPMPGGGDTRLTRRYNVIFIMTESTRHSVITGDITPNIHALGTGRGITKEKHFSGSNSTHLGIFSLLYGINPYYNILIKTKRVPSVPIEILKANGYQRRLYQSASIKWHRMDLFFEKNFDSIFQPGEESSEIKDRKVTDAVLADIGAVPPGRNFFYMIFFDSSHYPFYFPKGETPFSPFLDERFDKSDPVFLDRVRPKLLNSYYNSLHYLDGLIGQIVNRLKSRNLLKDTIIVITSDHACEFGEDHHYFYSSTLSRYQTQVPLIILTPSRPVPKVTDAASGHVDIFPTVLDIMGYRGSMANMQGHSLFRKGDEYTIITFQEALTPRRFSILDTRYKLEVDYDSVSFIRKMTDFNDREVAAIPDLKKRVDYLIKNLKYFEKKK